MKFYLFYNRIQSINTLVYSKNNIVVMKMEMIIHQMEGVRRRRGTGKNGGREKALSRLALCVSVARTLAADGMAVLHHSFNLGLAES